VEIQPIRQESYIKFREQREPTGFLQTVDSIPNATSQISFVDGTRTFTIQPFSNEFFIYHTGKRFKKTSAENLQISDVEGSHFIYYNNAGVLLESLSSAFYETTILSSEVPVVIVYWDATNKKSLIFEERHMNQMAGQTRANLHLTRSSQFISGSAINTINTDQSGNDDSHAQYGMDAGEMRDEDIRNTASGIVYNVGTKILYLEGAANNWRWTTNSGFNVLTTGTGRLAYNQFTGGVWQLSEVSNGKFALYHTFHTNAVDKIQYSIMGQNEYNSIIEARDGAIEEMNNLILVGLPTKEFVPISSVTLQSLDAYANSVKSRTRSISAGIDWVDWRLSGLSPATISISSHLLLADLNGGDDVGNHTNAFNLLGRNGGQTAVGGKSTTEQLTLKGNSVDPGETIIDTSGVTIEEGRPVFRKEGSQADMLGEVWSDISNQRPGARFIRHKGTRATPAALTVGMELGEYIWKGNYDGSNTRNGMEDTVAANENWDGSNGGTKRTIKGVSDGATALADWLRMSNGELFFPALSGAAIGANPQLFFNIATGKMQYDSSALKYKENVRDLIDVSWLYSLRPVLFDKKDGSESDVMGLIAEEVELINSKLVYYKPGRKIVQEERTFIEVDENGEQIEVTEEIDVEEYDNENMEIEGVAYSELIPALLKEIKNLNDRITALENA
jgi:hypothetical protein